MPIDRWMGKEEVVHTYLQYLRDSTDQFQVNTIKQI